MPYSIQQRSFHIHNDMIKNARASIDCKPGKVQRRRNRKKEQMEEGALPTLAHAWCDVSRAPA